MASVGRGRGRGRGRLLAGPGVAFVGWWAAAWTGMASDGGGGGGGGGFCRLVGCCVDCEAVCSVAVGCVAWGCAASGSAVCCEVGCFASCALRRRALCRAAGLACGGGEGCAAAGGRRKAASACGKAFRSTPCPTTKSSCSDVKASGVLRTALSPSKMLSSSSRWFSRPVQQSSGASLATSTSKQHSLSHVLDNISSSRRDIMACLRWWWNP